MDKKRNTENERAAIAEKLIQVGRKYLSDRGLPANIYVRKENGYYYRTEDIPDISTCGVLHISPDTAPLKFMLLFPRADISAEGENGFRLRISDEADGMIRTASITVGPEYRQMLFGFEEPSCNTIGEQVRDEMLALWFREKER